MSYPHLSQMNQFWSILIQESCSIVVLLTGESKGREDVNVFWFQPETIMSYVEAGFTVWCVDSDEEGETKELSIKIIESKTKKSNAQTHSVIILRYDGWPNHDVPSSTSSILQLHRRILELRRSEKDGPISIVCSDGVGRSGTLITSLINIESIKDENSINVFQTITGIHSSGQNYVENEAQLKFCYGVTMDFIDSFSDYENFVNENEN